MATVKEILESRLSFVATMDSARIDTIIASSFVNCEGCFGIRWVEVECVYAEDWTRVGVELNYTPLQIQLVAIMSAISILESKAIDSSTTLQDNVENATPSRFISEVKAGSTDTKLEQYNKDNLPFVANIGNLLSMLKDEAKALSATMGCHISGSVVQVMFSENLISSPFYVHKSC